MAGTFRPSQATWDQVAQAETVSQAVDARARRLLQVAKREAYAAGRKNFGDKLRFVSGTRPGAKSTTGVKRPYGRVVAEMTQEDQAADNRIAKLSRTKILRRAARG